MTDKEKAEMHDHWKDYYEPLARIFREVKRSVPLWKNVRKGMTMDYLVKALLNRDSEVRDELKRLLTQMITEIENGMD